MELTRIVIYTKDVQRITGKSDRHCRRILKRLRQELGKQKHHPITITEFCRYMKVDTAEIQKYLLN
jgi:ribosomal protein S3